MASVLDPIVAQIEPLVSAVDAAGALLVDLATRVKAAPTLADAQAVADAILAQKDELTAAVVANTPSA